MSIPPNINAIFNIDEEVEEVDMDLSDNDIDFILDATDGVGHVWEGVEDDNTMSEETSETERMKTHLLPVDEYTNWIKDLEKAGLSYVKHDRQNQLGGKKKISMGRKMVLPSLWDIK